MTREDESIGEYEKEGYTPDHCEWRQNLFFVCHFKKENGECEPGYPWF